MTEQLFMKIKQNRKRVEDLTKILEQGGSACFTYYDNKDRVSLNDFLHGDTFYKNIKAEIIAEIKRLDAEFKEM